MCIKLISYTTSKDLAIYYTAYTPVIYSTWLYVCVDSMTKVKCASVMYVCQVPDTHELSASLCESLRTVTSWKFTPKSRCHSAQVSVMTLLFTKQIPQKHFKSFSYSNFELKSFLSLLPQMEEHPESDESTRAEI